MAKIKLVEEQIDAIVVKELKSAYKMITTLEWFSPAEVEILDSIETMLKYYMVESEAEEWIEKHARKN